MMEKAYEYALDANAAFREQETDIFFNDFEHYMEEINVLARGYIEGKIVLEDVEVDNDKTGRNILGQIIDFIKRMIAKFIDTAKNLFKNNSKWFSDNVHKFDAITDQKYEALTITILPYWKVNGYKVISPSIKATDNRLGKEFKDSSAIETAMYPNLVKNTVSNNLVEGAKIEYRGGTNNLESIKGGAVKNTVKEMINYCNHYVETANNIKTSIEEVQKQVEDSQDELDKAMEDFSIAEGIPIMETVYATMPWVDKNGEVFYVMEANNRNGQKNNVNNGTVSGGNPPPPDNTQNQNPQQTNTNQNGQGKATSKPPDNNGSVQSAGQDEIDKKAKDDAISSKSAIKIYYQLYLKVATAMMTIAEERYLAYIRTLRSVLSSATSTEVKKKE